MKRTGWEIVHVVPAGPAVAQESIDPLVLITSNPCPSAVRWYRLAILPHHLQTQLDRLTRVRLRFFQGFTTGDDRGQLGAGDREAAFGLGPEAAEIRHKRLPT